MHRDPLPVPLKRRLSSTASPRFFYLADAIAKYNEPTQTQLEALERSYMATGQYVMESPEFRDITVTVHAQGSRATGTLVRPMRERPEGFDVDIVVRLHRQALGRSGYDPSRLINELYRVLKRYADAHGLKLTRWERCVTLEYAGGMCVDITPIVEDPLVSIPHGETHARVPDRKLQMFEPTNPLGLVRTFGEAAKVRAAFTAQEELSFAEARADLQRLPDAEEVQSRLLSRLVQLLKLHRNIAFKSTTVEDFSPRSVFLTALAATAYAVRAPLMHDSPLDLLLDIVDTMPLFFQRIPQPGGGEYWLLPNLTAPGDNLASGMNTPARQAAFAQWHARLQTDLQRLIESVEQREGLDVLQRLVEGCFGPRAAQAVREISAPKPASGSASGAPDSGSRIISVGTILPAVTFAAPARAHKFFGAP